MMMVIEKQLLISMLSCLYYPIYTYTHIHTHTHIYTYILTFTLIFLIFYSFRISQRSNNPLNHQSLNQILLLKLTKIEVLNSNQVETLPIICSRE